MDFPSLLTILERVNLTRYFISLLTLTCEHPSRRRLLSYATTFLALATFSKRLRCQGRTRSSSYAAHLKFMDRSRQKIFPSKKCPLSSCKPLCRLEGCARYVGLDVLCCL